MPIDKDLSDLPSGGRPVGNPPDRNADIMERIARAIHQKYVDDEGAGRPFSIEGVKVRGSWATKCARQISYFMLGVPQQERSLAGSWAMYLGKMVHALVEDILVEAFPGCQVEVTVDLRPDVDGSGSVDAVITMPDGTIIVFELKTINGFGYKLSATGFKGPADGPKYAHKVQGALYAHGLKADRLVIGYISMEAISPDVAATNGLSDLGRIMAQWSYTPDEFEPWAERELKRLNAIVKQVDAAVESAQVNGLGDYDSNLLPPRQVEDPEVPPSAVIVDPTAKNGTKGRWEVIDDAGRVTQTGLTWICGYCDVWDRCVADG